MGARFRSWWQRIKKHRVAIGVVAIVLVVAITLIIVGYWFDWAGFNGYNKITVAHTISGTNAGTVIRTEEYQSGRTLWDWMQLLIIPVVLAVGGYVINLTISRGEQEATKQRAKTEQEIASDNQREMALQDYIDKMSELLLDKDHPLRESASEDEVRKIARVRTLTMLTRLDNERKKSVLQFLHESGLIETDKHIIDLRGANLRGADLYGANLSDADLRGADLYGADLYRADLRGADLSEAILGRVNLSGANLGGADLGFANLTSADLGFANLNRVNLSGAKLNFADLSGADLSEADLRGANLSRVNLSEADFRNAQNTTDEQLNKARLLKGAIMPDGSKHP